MNEPKLTHYGADLRYYLAEKAYQNATDLTKTEQLMKVTVEIFEACLTDKSKFEAETARKRGFIRTFYKPSYIDLPNDQGKLYCHGIVNIVNVEAEINIEYRQLVEDHEFSRFIDMLKRNKWRYIGIEHAHPTGSYISFTPQRYNFDD